jgi:hypothetical protein
VGLLLLALDSIRSLRAPGFGGALDQASQRAQAYGFQIRGRAS